MNQRLTKATLYLAHAVNALLIADGSTRRVTPDIIVASRDGWTYIALREKPQPPTGDVPPPIDRTHLRRDPARGG